MIQQENFNWPMRKKLYEQLKELKKGVEAIKIGK